MGDIGEETGFGFVQFLKLLGLRGQHNGLVFQLMRLGFQLLILFGDDLALSQQYLVITDF